MFELIIILACLILTFIAVKYPPLMLAIYSIFSNIADGYGIGSLLRLVTNDMYTAFMSALLLISVLVSFFKIHEDVSRKHPYKRELFLSKVVIGCTIWIGILVVIKNGELKSIPNAMTNFGLPCMIIVFAYYRTLFAKYLLIICILINLIAAFSIIIAPNSIFSNFAAVKYDSSRQDILGDSGEVYNLGVARFSGQNRLSAHFYNQNGYGFYSIIGIILGFYILFNKEKKYYSDFFGLLLLVLGLFGWSVTFSRSTTGGLFIGCIYAYFAKTKRQNSLKVSSLHISFVLILLIIIIIIPIPWNDLASVLFNERQDEGISSRLEALIQGWDVFTNYPLIGAPLDYIWNRNVAPHQIMIYSTVIYGLFFGLFITSFFLFAIKGIIINYVYKENIRYFFIIVLSVTISNGLTNNFAVPILFWVCVAITCIPWCQTYKINSQIDVSYE
ncbi:MAG: O-antigen ligase family protein [Desulfuromonadales bacterium]